MIEGMFVFLIGILVGVAAMYLYMSKQIEAKTSSKKELFDESKYLTPDKKYFTNKSFEEEGGK